MTYWADVSEWQTGLNDSYPYRIVCIRSNDGTYRDQKWANNYAWCKRAADDGRLDCFIVYMVYRTNWQQTLDTFKTQVGSPHAKMVAMVDVESWGGQIVGNQSTGINSLVDGLAAFLGSRERVIAYGNQGDLNNLWPSKPNIRLIVAGYSANKPNYSNQIGWQYTDGTGYGPSGWPQGCAPFGSCDMNYTDLSSTDFAAQCGIGGFLMSAADSANAAQLGPTSTWDRTPRQIAAGYNPDAKGAWAREAIEAVAVPAATAAKSRSRYADTTAGFKPDDLTRNTDARVHELFIEFGAVHGDPDALAVLKKAAEAGDTRAQAIVTKIEGA